MFNFEVTVDFALPPELPEDRRHGEQRPSPHVGEVS